MPKDQENTSNDNLTARIAVSEGAKDTKPTIVVFNSDDEKHIEYKLNEDDPRKDLVSQCTEDAINSLKNTKNTSFANVFEEAITLISSEIEKHGLKVRRIPDADFTVNMEFDFSSGMLIGRQNSLHFFGTPNEDIGQNIMNIVGNVFAGYSENITVEIQDKIKNDDHCGAAQYANDPVTNSKIILYPSHDLFEALATIDRSKLSSQHRVELLKTLVAMASKLRKHLLGGPLAEELLQEDKTLKEQAQFSLKNIIAISALKRGEAEYALSIWKELLAKPELIDAGERGWICRNYSMALKRDNPEALVTAQQSVDSFLEAGDKREAANSISQILHLLEEQKPSQVISQYDKMLSLISEKGMINEELCAEIYHKKGSRLLQMGAAAGALRSAQEAVKLRRGLLGAEEHLISSLHLAALAAEQAGEEQEEASFKAEALALEQKTNSYHYAFARRLTTLMEAFDPDEAIAIMAEAENQPDPDIFAGAGVAVVMADPNLSTEQRLRKFEAHLVKLKERGVRNSLKQPAYLAIANCLRELKEYKRASTWYEKILADNPLDHTSRQMLVDSLWEAGDWAGAATYLKKQLDEYGEKPGLLFAHGKSLFETGDMSGAVAELSKALKLTEDNVNFQESIRTLRDRALDLGGTIIPEKPEDIQLGPVSIDEVNNALNDFSNFISCEKRMDFWKKPKGAQDYSWRSYPEKHGQTLLHTYLKGRFRERVDVFEEISVGAGRLDLLMKFSCGLSIIIELKMCGFRYSAPYAKSGEEQIQHYMDNRGVHIGFLIVFDSRLIDFEKPLLDTSIDGKNTVTEMRIDVRPRVGRK